MKQHPAKIHASLRCVFMLLSYLLIATSHTADAAELLHMENCRIVDNRVPVKAMGVNYVNGFWGFVKDGKRENYIPYLDALAAAKIPFIRMSFGPWAAYKDDAPPAPQIADFVLNRQTYFERLDVFLADLQARHIGVVLDVFWNIDPYTVYFREPASASTNPTSRTSAFLADTVAQLAKRLGNNPEIWMIEFENEGNLGIDYPKALHARADLIAQTKFLSLSMRAAGDHHLIDSGNAAPRPAAEHLAAHQGWVRDSREEFFHALDAETTDQLNVASVHLYPEKDTDRPWDGRDIMGTLPALAAHSHETCQPIFIGEFGAQDETTEDRYIQQIAASDIPLAAVWGFGRTGPFPLSFNLGEQGQELLRRISQTQSSH
jgi:hypothetical protein